MLRFDANKDFNLKNRIKLEKLNQVVMFRYDRNSYDFSQ